MNYAEAEEYINQIPRFSKVKSEENVDEILALFGHPEKKFAYIHVAGTNGKGSVCAFLDSMLRMAGKKTGLFTSPHLITTTERMKINGQNISEEAFTEIFEELLHAVKVREKAGHLHPTYFEWLYLMAMIWFDRQGIEYGIIETGLGGRLDATNHIAQPVLTIITSISYDHMEILGSTLTEIAGEKAGILKAGVPVICDGSEPEAVAVIRQKAALLHCPLKVIEPEQVKILLNRGKNIDFLLQDHFYKNHRLFPVPEPHSSMFPEYTVRRECQIFLLSLLISSCSPGCLHSSQNLVSVFLLICFNTAGYVDATHIQSMDSLFYILRCHTAGEKNFSSLHHFSCIFDNRPVKCLACPVTIIQHHCIYTACHGTFEIFSAAYFKSFPY